MTETSGKSDQCTPGDVIAGRFRITGTVGKGAMGAVYAAEPTGPIPTLPVGPKYILVTEFARSNI